MVKIIYFIICFLIFQFSVKAQYTYLNFNEEAVNVPKGYYLLDSTIYGNDTISLNCISPPTNNILLDSTIYMFALEIIYKLGFTYHREFSQLKYDFFYLGSWKYSKSFTTRFFFFDNSSVGIINYKIIMVNSNSKQLLSVVCIADKYCTEFGTNHYSYINYKNGNFYYKEAAPKLHYLSKNTFRYRCRMFKYKILGTHTKIRLNKKTGLVK